MLRPKIIDTLKTYSWSQFKNDTIAGIIVGIVALPLAIAFAIASGVSPEKGLITAVVAGVIISGLGGSRVQIGGPTGAFVVIVYDIVQKHGVEGLAVATLLGGIMLCILGMSRMGAAIKFVPYPVIVGFTSGIAVIIFLSQIKDLLGLEIATMPAEFFGKCGEIVRHLHSINPYAAATSGATIVLVLLFLRVSKRIPGSFVAIIATTAVVHWFQLPVETIGSKFGEIPHTIPWPQLPRVDGVNINELIRPAFTIAMLAGIESLLSAIVADGMIGGKHRSNMELLAQGLANIASPLFGGIPATGAIARTATNVHNGGRTPVAGIVHAVTLLLIMLVFGKWASMIPLATLAGILVIVAYRMGEWHSFAMVLRAPKSDTLVLVVTFLLTVIFDLTVAIEIGIVLAALLFIHRLSQTASVSEVTGEFFNEEDRDDPDALSRKVIPPGIEVFEISGPFFFGMASTFMETMSNIEKNPAIRILRMRHVSSIDATALNALRRVIAQSKHAGVTILLSGVQNNLLNQLRTSGIVRMIGEENILVNIDRALARAAVLTTQTGNAGNV
ncbi:MAG: STAS domain-containing protein [Candidatus Omnitrophica bacterium]|nr:STAS domain-containing protein [Candidatus Omnitrophota bacterium]MCB9719474.1 STAS domain-containing protein [Candidatus Omnitrophota bacterium]